MISNRKARLLLGVPARNVGIVCSYNISNRTRLFCYAGESRAAAKQSPKQKQRADLTVFRQECAAAGLDGVI